MNTIDDIKLCNRCGDLKFKEDFYKAKCNTDGLQAFCKRCDYLRTRKYKNDREHVRKVWREWRARNAAHVTKRSTEWRRNNPASARACKNRRRARIVGSGGNFTPAQWRALVAICGGKCLACGLELPLTVDHIIPVSQGGSNDITNIQPLCRRCNLLKGIKIKDYRYGACKSIGPKYELT